MAFQLQGWNPPGVSLSYRPQTQTFANPINAQDMDMLPSVPPVQDPRKRRVLGEYVPGSPMPTIGARDNFGSGLDKLMQATGMLGQQDKGSGFRMVDPRMARNFGMLARGNAAGTGQRGQFNEQALSALLSLGAPAPNRRR